MKIETIDVIIAFCVLSAVPLCLAVAYLFLGFAFLWRAKWMRVGQTRYTCFNNVALVDGQLFLENRVVAPYFMGTRNKIPITRLHEGFFVQIDTEIVRVEAEVPPGSVPLSVSIA